MKLSLWNLHKSIKKCVLQILYVLYKTCMYAYVHTHVYAHYKICQLTIEYLEFTTMPST